MLNRLCGRFFVVVNFQVTNFAANIQFGDYILDFVCLSIKLVIEVDGGQHCSQAEYDEGRTKRLQSAGYHVLRFWNNEVLEELEAVKEKIWTTIEELDRQPHPPPNLPLEGGGIFKDDHPLEREGENQEHSIENPSEKP
jgi:very-short-patch-repair endonuclease